MCVLSSPTDPDLALYTIAETSQKEVSAAAAELSSAKSLLHAPQSAYGFIPDFSWSCGLFDPVYQHLLKQPKGDVQSTRVAPFCPSPKKF